MSQLPHCANVSQSIEFLVNRPVMDDKMSLREDPSSTCWMFDCWTAKQTVAVKRESYAHKRASRRIGKDILYSVKDGPTDHGRR